MVSRIRKLIFVWTRKKSSVEAPACLTLSLNNLCWCRMRIVADGRGLFPLFLDFMHHMCIPGFKKCVSCVYPRVSHLRVSCHAVTSMLTIAWSQAAYKIWFPSENFNLLCPFISQICEVCHGAPPRLELPLAPVSLCLPVLP